MKRLVFSDVDGTILRPGVEEPSPRVVAAVNQMHQEQRELVPFTSRSIPLMSKLAVSLGLWGPGVLDGGATIFDFNSNERSRELSRWLNPEKVYQIVAAIGQHCVEIYYDQHSRKHTPDTVNLDEIKDESPSVFAVYDNRQTATILHALSRIEGISKHPNTYDGTVTHSCIQVVREGVSKHSGLDILLASKAYQAFTGEDMLAIGDGNNDVDLLNALPEGGLKVAMGNAGDVLKAEADVIVPSVHDDGFAVAIEQYVLGR